VVRNLVLITAWVWAGYLVGREHILKFEWDLSSMDPTMQPLMRSVGLDRVLMPVVLIGHYAALFVWPARLSLDYGADVIGYRARVGDPYLWIGFAAIGGWCCAVIVAWVRRSGFIVFTLFAMAVTYGVVGNILTLIGTNFGERLVYLPSAFLIMAVAGVATRLRPRSWMPAVMIVVLVGSVKTFTAARDWNDPLVLYQRALAATPRSIQVQLMLSAEYRSRGNATAADAVMDEVCREYPGYWRVWMFRASADMDEGDLVRARRDLNHAIHLDAQPILLAVQGRLDHLLAATRPVKQ
jgi:hypothetical protein